MLTFKVSVFSRAKFLQFIDVKFKHFHITVGAFKGKDISDISLLPKYDSKAIEYELYEWWEKQNFFRPSKTESESFVLLLPPPNITGTLHLGHALTVTIQDVIARWRKMKGESVLWIPGIDHAGIATQVAVEKYLMNTLGKSKYDLGRDEFVKKIWEWKKIKETTICDQLRSLGASLDWSKFKFTMDPVHSTLVNKCFIKLFNEGLIYRSASLVNWSCSLASSVSDIEIDWMTIDKKTKINIPGYEKPVEFGLLYNIAYKIYGEDDEIVVSTTRPETLLGDTAIAVNPNSSLAVHQNKMVWHPFRNEKIPIIVSDIVDPSMGTGAVKITPSHSLVDFEIGLKHNFKRISAFDDKGIINKIGMNQKFYGLKRFDARTAILNELQNLGLLRNVTEHSMKIPICSRSGDVVEQIYKKQWFLKCKPLAEKACNAVKSGDLNFDPKNYLSVWNTWLENIRDWNLSRQLWWGHQVPMYECTYKEKKVWIPALNLQEAQLKASETLSTISGNITITQDPDVIDTWFSSSLLPLNTLSNYQLKDAAPISLMVTGHDILFFWVARMVMLSLHLTGKLPFHKVLLHGLMCDGSGKKMSKSLGNIIKPEDIINGRTATEMKNDIQQDFKLGLLSEKSFKSSLQMQQKILPKGIPACGADSLRFGLCLSDIRSAFINFNAEVCVSSKFFCNKLWQAMKYFIKITDHFKVLHSNNTNIHLENKELEYENLNFFDKWILSRLAATIEIVDKNMTLYKFSACASAIKYFIIDQFCNIYLESSKTFLWNYPERDITIILIFYHCINTSVKMLSPFMPFITEYLYQATPHLKGFNKYESITMELFDFNVFHKFYDKELEKQFKKILTILNVLRGVIETYKLRAKKPDVSLECSVEMANIIFSENTPALIRLGKINSISQVSSFKEDNVIKKVINSECIAYIKHDYDKKTLMELFRPVLNKEDNLKATLENLSHIKSEEEWETKHPFEKVQHIKLMNNLKEQLEKIDEFKNVISRCNS